MSARRSPTSANGLSSDIEDRLRRDKGVSDVNVNREDAEGHYDIVLTFDPTEQVKVDDALLREYRKSLDLVKRDPATGVVRLRLDPDQIDEVRDYALRQGIETIRNRVDKLGVSEPTIIKKGTDMIVELPGLKPTSSNASSESSAAPRSSSSRSSTTARST